MKIEEARQLYSAQIKAYHEKQKESLWDNKETGETDLEDPIKVASNAEVFAEGPEIVDVADTVASVVIE